MSTPTRMTETPFPEPQEMVSAVRNERPIVFFDGICGFCNESVDLVLKWDRRQLFLFAPLQGETAQKYLTEQDTTQLSSVAMQDHGRIYRKSSAIVRILWRLNGWGKPAAMMLWLVPKPLRDFGYGVVAKHRYRWFGKKETCRMPTPEERQRFLP